MIILTLCLAKAIRNIKLKCSLDVHTETATGGVLLKKMYLKISQNSFHFMFVLFFSKTIKQYMN